MSKSNGDNRSYFEKQRDALIAEISVSMEDVLANMNALNRALEGINSVGKEFESVGELWSNFYDGVAQSRPTTTSGDSEPPTSSGQNQKN